MKKRSKSVNHGILKKLAALVLLCFAIRFLHLLGAGELFDGFIQKIGQSGGVAKQVLSFELKGVPLANAASAEPEETVTNEDGDKAAEDESSLYMSRRETPSPASPPQTPSVTATIAENAALPKPQKRDEPADGYSMEMINYTSYEIDIEAMLQTKPDINLYADKPQVLILHTHGSEAYCETSGSRTLDKSSNVVGIGDVLGAELEALGFNVIHDREIYDYPSYSGSYGRSLDAVEEYLEQNPEIQIVIDLHRDSLTNSDGSKFKTEYEIDGISSSKVMIIVSTGEAGLYHPNWQENLKFGLRLQKSMDESYPGLTRPICISTERYNQHAAPGYIIIEVGTDGNSYEEAANAARLFANAAAPVISELVTY